MVKTKICIAKWNEVIGVKENHNKQRKFVLTKKQTNVIKNNLH